MKFSFPRCHRDWYRRSKSIKAWNSDWCDVLDSDNSDNSNSLHRHQKLISILRSDSQLLFVQFFCLQIFFSFLFLSLDLKSTWPKNLAYPGRQKRSLQRQHQKRPCSHENVGRRRHNWRQSAESVDTNWLDQEASSWLSRPVRKLLDWFLEFSWQNYYKKNQNNIAWYNQNQQYHKRRWGGS